MRPPPDELFFPSGIAAAPDNSVVFVANSNSQLRYDSGTIDVIDLALVTPVIQAWLSPAKDPGDCAQDTDHRETLVCQEAPFIRARAGVRIGNFATDIAVQAFPGGATRLFVPTRGDPSIAWADYDGTSLSCSPSTAGFDQCDDAHRLTSVIEDPDQTNVPDEPFGVYATGKPDGTGFAVVTHQTSGAVTLVDSPQGGTATIADIRFGSFQPDLSTGLRGSTGVTIRPSSGTDPDTNTSTDSIGDLAYVGSRTEDRVQTFSIGRPKNDAPPYLVPGNFFFLDAVGTGTGTGGSSDTRGMGFSPTGNRLYLTNRLPPSLQIYDTTLGADGFPVNTATGASDICREASTLTVLDAGAGERVYVTCFSDGQVYVINPAGQSQLDDIISVGRGPYAITSAKINTGTVDVPVLKSLLFVSNFLEDTIAVIDVDPTSVTRNRVVLRIGTSKAP